MDGFAGSWRLLIVLGPLTTAAAAALSGMSIAVMRPWLDRYAMVHPNARSSHKRPTPHGGGIAVVAAILACGILSTFVLAVFARSDVGRVVPAFAAAAVLAAVGAVDDFRALSPIPRLTLQLCAVALVILTLPAHLRVISQLPLGLERGLLLVGGVWFVNAVNFMDGLDWMTVAETVPITGGLVLIGCLGALDPAEICIALALGGAVLGFAPFNRPVAKLFLGDVGSLPIGLLLGWLLLLVAARGYLVAALLLPLYYLADTGVTLVRRLAHRERIWEAHRTHFYQRATDRGFSVEAIVARVFIVNVGLAALATASVSVESSIGEVGLLMLGLALVGSLLIHFSGRR
jgi:UDP-N-acetylmuramyl pentapeptide phosphotransferase/UDP-N-acetylglucosamine-1-phosphate transferase